MKRRTPTALAQLRVDVILLSLLALVAVGWWLQSRPWLFKASDPEVTGTPPPPSPAVGDALLVLPALPDEPAASFGSLDMAMGWYNTLGQELGSFRHVGVGALAEADLAGTRLLVLPVSSAEAVSGPQRAMIQRWLEGGGLLLIEQPDARWSEALGVTLEAEGRPTRRLSGAPGVPTRGELRDALLNAPVLTTLKLAQGGPEGSASPATLLEVDGKPAMLHRARGRGHAYVLTVDLARAVVSLQQGRPQEDFSLPALPEGSGMPAGMTQPWVAVAAEELLDNATPYADLLERNVLEITSRHSPLPRLWYFPGALMGVWIMSHDEEAFGDKALFLTDWEHARGEASTTFVIPGPMSPEALRRMLSQGHDVQVHWNRGFLGERTSHALGLGPWRPVALEMSLTEQRAWIEDAGGGQAAALNRVHGLVWDQDWSRSFRRLAGAQIAADSTYGPTGPKQFGYLFGTGMPFYPLDRSGNLLPVLEVPFVLQDDENLQATRHRRMVNQSEEGFHQVIMPIYHSNTMANRPAVEVMQSWREGFEHARRHNHWVTTLRDYLIFDQARRSSTLSSRFDPESRRLEVLVSLARPRIKAALPPREVNGKVQAPAENEALCPALAVPQQYRGNGVEAARVDGATLPLRRMGRSGDGFFHTIPLSCGEHKVEIIYSGRESPLEPSP
jgi:hypothetical protein